MVTKVKYNIIATNKSKLYEMFIDLMIVSRVSFCACLMRTMYISLTIVVDHYCIIVRSYLCKQFV